MITKLLSARFAVSEFKVVMLQLEDGRTHIPSCKDAWTPLKMH